MISLSAFAWPRGQYLPDRLVRLALKFSDAPGVLSRRRFTTVRTSFYANMWQRAADDLGATVRRGPGRLTTICLDGMVTYVRNSDIMLDSALVTEALADKAMSFAFLSNKGLAVPEYQEFTLARLDIAREFLTRHSGGVVVKPACGTGGGRGVTTSITSDTDLTRAARYATSFNPRLLIEPQLSGHSYRLLYLDGKLIDAIRRDPPVVTGDGHSSVRALVQQENTKRLQGARASALSPLQVDRDCRIHLHSQGLSPNSRLSAGEVINLKKVVNENGAMQNHNVLAEVHPQIRKMGEALVNDLGVRFAGLDLMAPCLSEPLKDSGGTIGEINVNPGLHHHFLISDPAKQVPVATIVLDHMFGTKQGVMRV
jgi:D-alanine-D-alanine ligase-like ATP-grasp enzyme